MYPAIHPLALATISPISNERPSESNCTASIDIAHVNVIINENFIALLRSIGYLDCLVKPTIIKKISTVKRDACITLSMLIKLLPNVGMFCPGNKTSEAIKTNQIAV